LGGFKRNSGACRGFEKVFGAKSQSALVGLISKSMMNWPGKPLSTSVQVGQLGLQSFPAFVVLKTRPSSVPTKIVFESDGASPILLIQTLMLNPKF
jgi:hypothetical protein